MQNISAPALGKKKFWRGNIQEPSHVEDGGDRKTKQHGTCMDRQ